MIGAGKNPAIMIPGLCGQLQTNLFAVLPNTIPGATLYSQIFCLDAGQKGFWKLAVSDGMKLSIPTSGTKTIRPGDRQSCGG